MIVLNARFSKRKLQKLKGTTLRNMTKIDQTIIQ